MYKNKIRIFFSFLLEVIILFRYLLLPVARKFSILKSIEMKIARRNPLPLIEDQFAWKTIEIITAFNILQVSMIII